MEIKKYGFYAFTKNISENGVGIIVFDSDSAEVSGVKLQIGKTDKIKIPRKKFESLLAYNILEFIQLLPKNIWKEYKKVYNK